MKTTKLISRPSCTSTKLLGLSLASIAPAKTTKPYLVEILSLHEDKGEESTEWIKICFYKVVKTTSPEQAKEIVEASLWDAGDYTSPILAIEEV